MPSEPIVVSKRFRGPPESGNGGYVCGRLASFIDGPAAVRLRVPPPLDVPMEVRRSEVGYTLHRTDGEDVIVAEARPTELSLLVPEAPSLSEAEAAARRFTGFEKHVFPSCFVCGPERAAADGLRIFAGRTDDTEIVAAPWTPDASLGDNEGNVRPEFVWAALDCPGAFSFELTRGDAVLLGELTAALSGTLPVNEPCVVIGWEIGRERRKHVTGTAIFDSGGVCRGIAKGTWIAVSTAA
jgi:hypothetical protein